MKIAAYNKAIVALLGALVVSVNTFTDWKVPPELMSEGTLASIASFITMLLVYLIPNKDTNR